MSKTITIIGAGMTGSALAVASRVFSAISKRTAQGNVDLNSFPMLRHVADVPDNGKDAQLPWESFTFDQTE